MHDCIDTLDRRPLYFTKHDEAFTRLAVDYVARFTVFYLASSKAVHLLLICESSYTTFGPPTFLWYPAPTYRNLGKLVLSAPSS